jgi:hypothetical protein
MTTSGRRAATIDPVSVAQLPEAALLANIELSGASRCEPQWLTDQVGDAVATQLTLPSRVTSLGLSTTVISPSELMENVMGASSG